jgi:hypothetical protein
MNRHQKIGLLVCLGYLPGYGLADHPAFNIDGGAGSALTTIGAATMARSQMGVGIQYQYLQNSALSDAQLLNSAESAHSVDALQQASVSFSYGITDRLTASVLLPYVSRKTVREAEHEEGDHQHDEAQAPAGDDHPQLAGEEHDEAPGRVETTDDISGIGDMTLMFRQRFTINDGHQSALLLGLNFPTGSTDEKTANGEEAEVDLQPGSGSWDPLLGVAYTYQSGSNWSVSANVLYRYATEGARDTTLGSALFYNLASIWTFETGVHVHGDGRHHDHRSGLRFDVFIEANGDWRDRTDVNGVEDSNSGGNLVYGSGGVRLSVNRWSFQVAAGAPIVSNLNGLQSEPKWRAGGGVSYAL